MCSSTQSHCNWSLCYANENPPYINVMFISVNKPYNLRGVPLAEQPKVNTTYSGLNTYTYQIAKIWNSITFHLEGAFYLSSFPTLSNVYWNGMALFANVAAVFCVIHTKIFTSFIDAVYWLLINRHVFSTFNACFICFVSFSPVSYPAYRIVKGCSLTLVQRSQFSPKNERPFACRGSLYFRLFLRPIGPITQLSDRPVVITVKSQWGLWRLKSPAIRLLTQPVIQTQIKENIKAPATREFPAQRACNAKNVSIW